jgi:transcription-repair coupling factor (superfamily II helicase)
LTSPTSGVLSAIPRLLRAEPAVARALAAADGTLAVAGAAQPMLLAALAALTSADPLLVVTATGVEAERFAEDLACLLEPADDVGASDVAGVSGERVVALPAWETLPFERVSPDVETMGRRLALRWSLTHPEGESALTLPKVIVAPVRALLQRLGPFDESAAPVVVRPGQEINADALIARLVAMGYHREHQVEHRGELAVRGGIIDV